MKGVSIFYSFHTKQRGPPPKVYGKYNPKKFCANPRKTTNPENREYIWIMKIKRVKYSNKPIFSKKTGKN